jgi:hypothetical protein
MANYASNPILATWLTAGKNDAPGVLSVPTRCHCEKESTRFYGETAYHIYWQKTTKVIGAAPRIEWVFQASIKQDAWDKAIATLAQRPEAKAEFFSID